MQPCVTPAAKSEGDMRLTRFLRRRDADAATLALYGEIVAQSRQPAFYAGLGVPDTTEGRFDMIVLHMILLLRRVRRAEEAGPFAQDLFDTMFRQMDRNLREMGVGDLSVPKRVRKMAEAFYGRASVYDPALDAGDEEALALALRRNVFVGQDVGEGATPLARYALAVEAALSGAATEDLLAGNIPWPPVAVAPEGEQ